MSGLQSSISTHIARNYLNASTNSWGENPDLFMKAVGNHPDRLQVYFKMRSDFVILKLKIALPIMPL